MPNTALNRTTQVLLTNKSGGALVYGDVVVLDNTNANGFTTTTTAGLSTRGLGVILEVNGIVNNASGMVAVGGWCPKINLNTAAAVGQFIKTHTVAGQGTPHASPQVEGDFAVALSASATPPCNLFGSPNGPLSGGAGTVTNTGTLTSGKTIIGNGSADVTVSSLTAQFVGSSSGTEAAASMSTARILGRTTASSGAVEEITVGTGLTLSAGSLTASGGGFVLLEQHTASASASLDFTTCISSTYDDYQIDFVNLVPTNNNDELRMRLGAGSFDSGTNYAWSGWYNGVGDSLTGQNGVAGQNQIRVCTSVSNAAAANSMTVSGTWRLYGPQNTGARKQAVGDVTSVAGGNIYKWSFTGVWNSTSAADRFQFLFSSGTIASGTIRVYGIAK